MIELEYSKQNTMNTFLTVKQKLKLYKCIHCKNKVKSIFGMNLPKNSQKWIYWCSEKCYNEWLNNDTNK
jgi:hypothetical protein